MDLADGTAEEAYLEIINHTCLHQEKVTKYGQTYDTHVVVKNSPFVITLALRGCKTHDFNQLAFDVQLLYDMPNFDKLVPYVMTKPIEYKSTIGGEHGEQISFDVKVKVLSSHHEDNFFRLHFQVWDPVEKSQFRPLSIYSSAIKVISKPLKPKAKNKPLVRPRPPLTSKRKAYSEDDSEEERHDPPSGQQMALVASMESRLEALARQQQETLELLRQLTSSALVHSRPPPGIENGTNLLPAPPTKRPRTEGPANPDDFENAFSTMLQAYSSMSNEMKAEKVRRLVRSLPTRDSEALEELFDVLATQGVRVQAGTSFTHGHVDSCGNGCPHREELQRVEDFFNEVFY